MTSWVSLGEVLQQVTHRPQWGKYHSLRLIRSYWSDIVGEYVARQSYPTAVYQEVLQVAVASAVWAQELTSQRSLILGKVNDLLGRYHLHPQRDIHFSTKGWHQHLRDTPRYQQNQKIPSLPMPQTPVEAFTRFMEALHKHKR